MTRPIQILKLVAASCVALSSAPAFAQESNPVAATANAGYALPETQTWSLKAKDGYAYRIFVSKPTGEEPEGGYPVLYVLDGNAMFAAFAETRRNLAYTQSDLGKTIIVGVGYDVEEPWAERRLYDLTGPMPIPAPWDKQLGHLPAGGWNAFLDFLTGTLRDEIDKRYGVNDDRLALFGHSLGGLFAIHALYEKPEAFHAIIAASPSLFWHDHAMLKAEQEFGKRLQAGKIPNVARLRVVTGELEETALERSDAEAFAKRMAPLSAHGLRSEFELFENEIHVTVPVRSVTSTMRFAFAWP